MFINGGPCCKSWNFCRASEKFLLFLLIGGVEGGFVGLVGKIGFGTFVFLSLDFLEVVARPLWVSRDSVPPVLMKI